MQSTMRKILLLLLTLFACTFVQAQNRSESQLCADFQNGYRKYISMQDRVISGHGIGLNSSGLGYQYELAVTRNSSLVFNAGINTLMQLSHDFVLIDITLGAEAEWRYYYNLQERHLAEKRTYGNSGAYISADVFTNIGTYYSIGIGPSWGFRRAYDKLLVDFGINSAVGITDGDPTFFIRLKLGLMYRF